jgi:two-component sensor histidine kinase
VQSIAAQSARRAQSLKQFISDFEGRLVSLARTHDVLTQNAWTGAELSVLLDRELSAYRGQVRLKGPEAELAVGHAQALALIVHELSTNASKYGALSVPGGAVDVAWSCEAGKLSLSWTERGGPPAAQPAEQGFGSRLIEKLVKGDLRGRSEMTFAPEGLVFRLEMPTQG